MTPELFPAIMPWKNSFTTGTATEYTKKAKAVQTAPARKLLRLVEREGR
jgi:hypothetical protein